ncbi:YDG/SRA domain-containing protein [Hymenobacter sediminicola]|uniref:HNH endonuclease n=1 Tax=Hymenobacter sediminicola TaxID=2761579 RepID=A0A7G7W9S4_9BACT|nr:YDG/SRA domain-containing protein [Hymenobacter sediminicola]QNH63117.1 HNH endonuclease [Hymenobacter sediminicola]
MAQLPNPIRLGEVPQVLPGYEFLNRSEVKAAGLHRDLYKGISSLKGFPAEAIVLSGGYEDDVDLGCSILYTGEGGNQDGRQVADQQLTGGNLALSLSFAQQTPVRVIRKVQEGRLSFYQYAGLYYVTQFSQEMGMSGHRIWRFRLEQMPQTATVVPPQAQEPEAEYAAARRRPALVQQIVRDTAVMRAVKQLYDFRCQVCGTRLPVPGGAYSEAAHIRPLGGAHHGPDKITNLLCLCPNHHVTFDRGAWAIQEDFCLLGQTGQLTVAPSHHPHPEHLLYHRRRIYQPQPPASLFA